MDKKTVRLALVGAGHAHIELIRQIFSIPISFFTLEITFITSTRYAYYSGMIPGLVAGQYDEQDVRFDVEKIFAYEQSQLLQGTQQNKVIVANVVRVEADKKRLLLDSQESVEYDLVSFNIGSRNVSCEGAREHCIQTRPIGELEAKIRKREQELRNFQKDPEIVVCGGGAAGLELAFTLTQRWRKKNLFKTVTCTIIDSMNESDYAKNNSFYQAVKKVEKSLSIRHISAAVVVSVQKDKVFYKLNGSDERISLAGNTFIQCTGAEGHDLFRNSNLNIDKNGFMLVNKFLQSTQYDNIFGAGDCVQFESNSPPKAGVFAVRMAPILLQNIISQGGKIAGHKDFQKLVPYEPQREYLQILNVGDGTAIATKYNHTAHSFASWEWKNQLDLQYMQSINTIAIQGNKNYLSDIIAVIVANIVWVVMLQINQIYVPILYELRILNSTVFVLIRSLSNTKSYATRTHQKSRQSITKDVQIQNSLTTLCHRKSVTVGITFYKTFLLKPYYWIKFLLYTLILYLTDASIAIVYVLLAFDLLIVPKEIPFANAVSVVCQMFLL